MDAFNQPTGPVWLREQIGTPRQAHGAASADDYRRMAQRFIGRLGGRKELRKASTRPVAYVSAGRWVIDCPCGNGASAHPGGEPGYPDPIAVCFECGVEFRPTFPTDWEDAEAALLARPNVGHRNYFPRLDAALRRGIGRAEKARDLEAENEVFGLPRRGKRTV
jgi:hypothetical protein